VWEYRDIAAYIFLIGAAQGILLSFFLFRKKENSSANKFLAALMLIFAFDLVYGVYYLTGAYLKYPEYIGASQTLPYLYGPAIFIYVYMLSRSKEKIPRKLFIHFLPFLLMQIYGVFFVYFESSVFKLSLVDFNSPTPLIIEIIGNLIPLHGVTYVVFAVLEAKRYNRRIKNNFSNIDKINLRWLLHFVYGAAIVWSVVVVSYLLNYIYGDEFQGGILIYIVISILLYSLGIKSLRQPEVVLVEKELPGEISSSYEKSGLTNERAESINKALEEFIKKEKPYLNNKLSLSDLASSINISNHNLSEVINKKRNQNFYDFINSYRVDEVKRLIENDKEMNYSILALGYDAGFSSKSAFYSAFKKFTNQTPAQYREQFRLRKVV
jgi:AraC-like DNA-binding protein